MSDSDQPKSPLPTPQVPRLVDSYRSHREALHSRVQELVNLREQIKAAAAREATEIVDNARRDVRHILVKARRELLVLTAQVQAATDDAPRALDEGPERRSQRDRVLAEAARAGLVLEREEFGAAQDTVLGARQGVQQILESAKPDLDALDSEMRLLRAATGQPLTDRALPNESPVERVSTRSEPPLIEMSLTADASGTGTSMFPRVAAFVGAFAVLGIIVMIGTTWWRGSRVTAVEPGESASAPAPVEAGPAGSVLNGGAPVTSAPSAPVAVRLDALRDVWIRTTIDGQSDAGRLLRAGETRNIAASGDVAVRIGDGGALMISVNGSTPVQAGRDGQVVTRTFSPSAATSTAPPLMLDGPPADLITRAPSPGPAPVAAPPVADEPPPIITIDPPAAERPLPPPIAQAAPPPAAAAAGGPAPAPAAPGPRNTDAAEGELVPAAQRWFALYHTGQHVSAGGDAPNVTDDRTGADRPPQGAAVSQRVFDDVRVQLVGDNALYTARMTERVQTGNASSQYVSLVSQVWMRRSGMWRLVDVRLVGAGQLAQGAP